MRKIAIIGAGNVGVSAAKALFESCDMELCGFVRKNIKPVEGFEEIPVAESVFDLPKKPDGAIICVPSRFVDPIETELLINGIHTVDCFDIHEELLPLRKNLNAAAKMGNVSAIIGAGWDPGLDSVIRTLMVLPFSKGKTYTNFGPGMSMGHSAAAKSIDGIADAVSITIPLGNGNHRRKIYAVLKKNADKQAVEHAIITDGYFEHDECSVEFPNDISQFLN
ncbi:MAG: diaminopimelate dehydrogenase, partial [Oscillospiraceae bacterium]|nr:diaminopimelate dehydrogenase [Oscillospiraceae bacterium]